MRIAGRRIALLGFLLLSIAFFLPQVKGCSEPIVPAKEVRDGHVEGLLSLYAPFTFGFLGLVVSVVANVVRRVRVERLVSMTWCVLCTVFLLAVIAYVAAALTGSRSSGPLEVHALLAVLILAAVLIVVTAFRARRFRRLGLCTLCCGPPALAYFLYWIIGCIADRAWDSLCYGIWLSATSCLLITVGGLLDALAPPPKLAPSVDL